jgi:small conductance mechanosensitive channel
MFFSNGPAVPKNIVDISQDDASLRNFVHLWHHKALVFVNDELPQLLFILLLALIFVRIVIFFINRMNRLADQHSATNPQRASEIRTLATVIRATSYSIIGFVVLLHTLSAIHAPAAVTGVLASASVVGVGIGLGAQSLFKDIINGIFILIENQYNVGENVKLDGVSGTVENLTLRVTTLRDADGCVYFIPNSQVTAVANLSRDFSVATMSVSVDATSDPDRVLDLLRATAMEVRNDPAFQSIAVADPVIPGIDAIMGRVVSYPVSIRVAINQKDAILRELRRRILQSFEENGIPLGTDPTNMLLMNHADPANSPAVNKA